METKQVRAYENLASLLHEERATLPYSGECTFPKYGPGRSNTVHGYDIGGTLAGAENRDKAIREILGLDEDSDIKKVLFQDPEATKKISQAQERGIRDGSIRVNPLEGVIEQLEEEREKGEDRVLLTVGTNQMARSFINGAGIESYVSALVTSEEANTGNRKTPDMFQRAYEQLRARGKTLTTYCDDSEKDAMAAVEASRTVEHRYGQGFKVFLLKRDASADELGLNPKGYIVIKSIGDKKDF